MQGVFVRKQGASPCLQLLGPVISEARAAAISQSTANPPASAQSASAGALQAPNGTLQPAAGAGPQPKSQPDVHAQPAPLQNGDGPVSAHEGDAPQHPPLGDMAGDEVIMTTAEHPAAEADMAADAAEPAAPVAGPLMLPGWAPEAAPDAHELEAVTEEGALSGRAAAEAAVREEGVDRVGQLAKGPAEGEPMAPPAAGQRPIAGPARPPDELLAAAAEVHQAVRCTQPPVLDHPHLVHGRCLHPVVPCSRLTQPMLIRSALVRSEGADLINIGLAALPHTAPCNCYACIGDSLLGADDGRA